MKDIGDDFIRLWSIAALKGFLMFRFDELTPGVFDVYRVAVVGSFVDEDT